jgi:hypothetical protein
MSERARTDTEIRPFRIDIPQEDLGPDAGLGSRVPTLRERLPADLRDDEFAAEMANRTVHTVMHL